MTTRKDRVAPIAPDQLEELESAALANIVQKIAAGGIPTAREAALLRKAAVVKVPDTDAGKPKKRAPSNAFKPGQSGNPKGRPLVGESVAEIIRAHYPAEKLVKLIGAIAESGEKDQDRLKAATFLMERAYPAPPVKIEHSGHVGGVLLAPMVAGSVADWIAATRHTNTQDDGNE